MPYFKVLYNRLALVHNLFIKFVGKNGKNGKIFDFFSIFNFFFKIKLKKTPFLPFFLRELLTNYEQIINKL